MAGFYVAVLICTLAFVSAEKVDFKPCSKYELVKSRVFSFKYTQDHSYDACVVRSHDIHNAVLLESGGV